MIWPTPIDLSIYKNFNHTPKKFNIVSIGNLKKFKSYNLYMINVVEELINLGYNVKYDIYGEGPLKHEMLKIINFKDLENNIQIHGQINYNDIDEVLKSCFVFIGMGTSIIEAAGRGIPSIVAVESIDKPYTYGFFYKLPYYNLGELLETKPSLSIIELLFDLFNMSDDEYLEEGKKNKEYVKNYSIEKLMPEFEKIVINSSDNSDTKIIMFIKYYLMSIVNLFTRVRKIYAKFINN